MVRLVQAQPGSSNLYFQDPTNYGLAIDVVTNGNLEKWAIDADRNRLQICIHAIGDKANSYVLDMYEKIKNTNSPWDRRFRIEHAQHLTQRRYKSFFRNWSDCISPTVSLH